ncbi:MAG: T9SS type A sorting domain-containing protein, partial [Fibrobacter sp.]|nr:T9SS type A sorting domain-containing protein [Fibrobacter sp.]
ELIGLNGQVVAKGVVNAAKNTVNLNKAGNGVYILRATSKDINFSKMLTIN